MTVLFFLNPKNIPAARDGMHLGFAWGPGDILVFDTVYKAAGQCGTTSFYWGEKKPIIKCVSEVM